MHTVATDDIRERLYALLRGERVIARIDQNVLYRSLAEDPANIYSLLLVAGYLKTPKKELQADGAYLCEASIPNKEIVSRDFDVHIGGNVISMPTLKKAYGKDAIIFRLLNNTEKQVSTYIKVNKEKLPLNFGKYEVKTVICENGELTESYELLI